jgi:hypothetical protein
METGLMISVIGISLLLLYGITKILEFYGIGINVYGSYVAFYLFILLSVFILPTNYYNVLKK